MNQSETKDPEPRHSPHRDVLKGEPAEPGEVSRPIEELAELLAEAMAKRWIEQCRQDESAKDPNTDHEISQEET